MESQNLIETFTEDQQMQVFNLMALGNIEDINLAAQLLFEASFDVNVNFYLFYQSAESRPKLIRYAE